MYSKRNERIITGREAGPEALGRRRDENRKRRRESRERHYQRHASERSSRVRNSNRCSTHGKGHRSWGSFSRQQHRCRCLEPVSISSSSRSYISSCSRSTSSSVSRSTSSHSASTGEWRERKRGRDLEREVLEALKKGQRGNPLVPRETAEVVEQGPPPGSWRVWHSDSDEEEREKARAQEQESRLRDKISGYRQRLRKWEKRERAKAKKCAAERKEKYKLEEEHAKEVRRLQQFMSVYDDDKDDGVYFSGGALYRLRRFREREIRQDSRNRHQEHQDLKEIRYRLAKEGLKNPGAEAQRRYFGRTATGGLRKQRPRNFRPEPTSQHAPSGNSLSDRRTTTSGSRKPQFPDLAVTHPNFRPEPTSQLVPSGRSHSRRATTGRLRKHQFPDPALTHPNFRPEAPY